MSKTTKEITDFTLSEYDDFKRDIWYSRDDVIKLLTDEQTVRNNYQKKILQQLQKELKDMLDNWHIRNPATKMCINTVGMRMNDIFAKYLYSPSGLRRIDDESEAVDTPLMLGTKSNSQSNEHIHLFSKDTMICSVCGKKPSDIINKLSQSIPDKVHFKPSTSKTDSKSGGDALVHGLMSFGILKCKRCQHDVACKKTTKACHYFQALDMRS